MKTIFDEYQAAYDAYAQKFGKEAAEGLDYFFDPLHPVAEAVEDGIKKLRQAVVTNQPLPILSSDAYKDVVF